MDTHELDLARLEQLLARGVEIVIAMNENNWNEAVADNGMTVWDVCLTDWAQWADEASAILRQLRTPAPVASEEEIVEEMMEAWKDTYEAEYMADGTSKDNRATAMRAAFAVAKRLNIAAE